MTKLPFDRVVLSTDDNPMFFDFWPLVVKAWKAFFDNVPVTVAYIGKSPTWAMEKKTDRIVKYEPVDGIPTANHAKVARYLAAAEHPKEVCLIHDMDTLPLQRDYTIQLLSQRKPDHLLCVGREVYANTPHEGKFPAGHLTGEGHLFGKLFGDDINRFRGLRVFDDKENIENPPDQFSDESLIRALLCQDIPTQHVERNCNIYRYWLDRSWWKINESRLWGQRYVECNLLRPRSEYKKEIRPVVEYIDYIERRRQQGKQ